MISLNHKRKQKKKVEDLYLESRALVLQMPFLKAKQIVPKNCLLVLIYQVAAFQERVQVAQMHHHSHLLEVQLLLSYPRPV